MATVRVVLVELLYVDGCAGRARVLPLLERLAHEAGADLRLVRVATPAEAERLRFLGSPTVRVDGHDIEPGAAERGDFGVKCRLYRVAGRVGDAPPEAWLSAALR